MIDIYKYEKELKLKGYKLVCGTDEAGRGPIAGPVVAAAVILDEHNKIDGLNDSKKLTATKRDKLYAEINEKALAVGISVVEAEEIDEINILEASRKAMALAIENLKVKPDYILSDYMDLSIYTEIPFLSLTNGDNLSASIAAASIIAKVKRDYLMVEYSKKYEGYGFEEHKGYPTKKHLKMIEEKGLTPIHRKSYKPVKKYL